MELAIGSLSIFTVNVTIRKTQKSKIQEKIIMTAIPQPRLTWDATANAG